MHKVAPLFTLLGTGVLLAGGYLATVPTALASAAQLAAPVTATVVEADPTPPMLDAPGLPVLPSVVHPAPLKRKPTVTTKPRQQRCEIRPLQMGTVDTWVRACEDVEGSAPQR